MPAADGDRGQDGPGHRGDPDQRDERGGDRDQQAGRPGCAPGAAAGCGEDPGGHHGDDREQSEHHRRPEAPGGDRAHTHRQQGVGRACPDPGGHRGGDPAGGEERGQPGERDAADHDHVDGQPRLAAEQRAQRRDDGHVRWRGTGRPDPGWMESLQVLLPQCGHPAPGRAQRPARQRSRGEQRALRDQRDRGEPGEQQHGGIGQDALGQPRVERAGSPHRRPGRRWRGGCPPCRSGSTCRTRWRRTRPGGGTSGRAATRCAGGCRRRGGPGPGAAARPPAGTAG